MKVLLHWGCLSNPTSTKCHSWCVCLTSLTQMNMLVLLSFHFFFSTLHTKAIFWSHIVPVTNTVFHSIYPTVSVNSCLNLGGVLEVFLLYLDFCKKDIKEICLLDRLDHICTARVVFVSMKRKRRFTWADGHQHQMCFPVDCPNISVDASDFSLSVFPL